MRSQSADECALHTATEGAQFGCGLTHESWVSFINFNPAITTALNSLHMSQAGRPSMHMPMLRAHQHSNCRCARALRAWVLCSLMHAGPVCWLVWTAASFLADTKSTARMHCPCAMQHHAQGKVPLTSTWRACDLRWE